MQWGKLTIILFLLLGSLRLQARPQIRISSNLNSAAINPFATLQSPLEIPFPQPKQSDPNSVSHPPINEKQSIGLHNAPVPKLQWEGLRDRMVHIDYQMVFEDAPPGSMFEAHYNEEYHLLENLQFYVTMANPSESFSVCVSEIFSDCEGIKKMLKRPLPFCLSPFTKYPFYFNLYLTHYRNAAELKTAIFFNVSLKYEGNQVTTRTWMKEVTFKLLPNHLKLAPLEFRNCESENGTVFIKNPQKHDLSFLVIHKYKKYHFNGQQLDDKFVIAAQKSLRFLIEPRDSTMTIYSKTVQSTDRSFPVLFLPVYCFDKLIIENIHIGVISFRNAAFSYPLLLTSNSNASVLVEEITLSATSQTVDLIKTQHSKPYITPNEKQLQIAAVIVRASLKPSLKNTITLRVRYSLLGSSLNNSFEARRVITYSELHGAVEIGCNRYYELGRIPEGELSDSQRIQYFNYTITNQLQIPIRLEKVHFNKNVYHMHWFRYTGFYAFPTRAIDEILLEYVGPKNLSASPARHVVNFQFNGGIIVPVETLVFDRTLACFYQGKELRCSSIKYVSFGYQRSDQKVQRQKILLRNFNPVNITIQIEKPPRNITKNGIDLTLSLSDPFPLYNSELRVDSHKLEFRLRSGHCVNLTIEMRIKALPVSGETLLRFSTEFESFATRVKFSFEQGKLFVSPPVYIINHFDREHQGSLQLLSTYQDVFQIRDIVSDTTCLHFVFNESRQYEPNQKVLIPFRFVPNQEENNLTQDCCSEEFLRRHYIDSLIHYSQSQVKQHEVTVITSIDLEQQLTVRIDTQKARLLPYPKKISLNPMRVGRKTKVCLTVNNPYSATLKYGVFLVPDEVTYKPKAYSDYLKHARREKTQAFLCLQEKNSPSFIRKMFHLEQDPKQVAFDINEEGKIAWPQHYRENFSSNDYVNAFVKTGKERCYKFSTTLYFKLMIESEIINRLLEQFDFDLIEKFMEREWDYLQQNTIVAFIDEPFYAKINLDFKEYCNKIFFPIFRFCFFKPYSFELKDAANQTSCKNHSAQRQLLLNSNETQQFCISIPIVPNQSHVSFQLVLANNFSKFDDYSVEMELIEPEILISNIAFEREKVVENLIFIKHQTFVKHYFSALSKASPAELQAQSIVLSKVVPILLTNLDYEQEFQLFTGERFFEIENQASIDVPFSHFGFEDKENITSWSGLEVEAADGANGLGLPKNGKKVFRVSYRFDRLEELNLSNPYYHKKIQLYLYQGEQYYLPLTLLIRVSENSIQKLKGPSVPTESTSTRLPYVLLNFFSLAYICFAILYFVREQKVTNMKAEAALLKHKKAATRRKEKKLLYEMSYDEEIVLRNDGFLPESIGTPILNKEEFTYTPNFTVSEEDLTFFKSLKVEKDRSLISQSSEDFRLVNEQIDKTQQRSHSCNKSSHSQQSNQHSEGNEIVLDPSEGDEDFSQESYNDSVLPDGISVCNEKLESLDQFEDFQFGTESPFGKKDEKRKRDEKGKKQEQFGYYDVFSSHNLLKKQKQVVTKQNPFPWLKQNEKKKTRTKQVQP